MFLCTNAYRAELKILGRLILQESGTTAGYVSGSERMVVVVVSERPTEGPKQSGDFWEAFNFCLALHTERRHTSQSYIYRDVLVSLSL